MRVVLIFGLISIITINLIDKHHNSCFIEQEGYLTNEIMLIYCNKLTNDFACINHPVYHCLNGSH